MLRAHGCEGEPPIVGAGPGGARVHDLGSGPIQPGESIIIDVFPKDSASRFCADMTRTFCFGDAPDQLRHMHAVVSSRSSAAPTRSARASPAHGRGRSPAT